MGLTMAKKQTKARKVLQKPPILGWKTSDSDEIELRRWRGRTEIAQIEALEPNLGPYGTFRARSSGGGLYEVEICDLKDRTNSCGCADHRVNGLGTCKHIEGVLFALRKRLGARAFAAAAARGSPRVEVFLRRDGDPAPSLGGSPPIEEAIALLHPFLDEDGKLGSGSETVARLLEAVPGAPADIRVSRHIGPESSPSGGSRPARGRGRNSSPRSGRAAPASMWSSRRCCPISGRARLIWPSTSVRSWPTRWGSARPCRPSPPARCSAREKGVERVLVVSPTSVKAEWEEQIARFTDRVARFVAGPYPERLKLYGAPAFFTLVNYEQVVRDADDLNRLLKPDVVILDEAQRIKNWHTRTARRVKSLVSPFAFVLTGTPLENRIDETYRSCSISTLRSSARCSASTAISMTSTSAAARKATRTWMSCTGASRAWCCGGESATSRTSCPAARRRRSSCPWRRSRLSATAIMSIWPEGSPRSRSAARSTREEFERLQQYLACMRVICDTPAILDPECRVCPKLEELEGVLSELLEESARKIVVFSEWVKMLELARELAAEMGVDCAWHTGDVPQLKRRGEIARFREDPACRLFLSSDAGATGLNLQMANAVINLDLPWNPAKLEQRIALGMAQGSEVRRNGRQFRHRKFDRAFEPASPFGQADAGRRRARRRGGFLQDRDALGPGCDDRAHAGHAGGGEPIRIKTLPPEEALVEDLKARHGGRLLHAERRAQRLLLVLDAEPPLIAAERARLASSAPVAEILDRAAWQTLQRLAEAGLIGFTETRARILHESEAKGGVGQDMARFDPAARAA